MASKITKEMKNEYFNLQEKFDIVNRTIQSVEKEGLDTTVLYGELSDLSARRDKVVEKIKKGMTLANNTVQIRGSWYAIRYVDGEGDRCVVIHPVQTKDLPIFKRDGRKESELTEDYVMGMLDVSTDMDELQIYNATVDAHANARVSALLNSVSTLVEDWDEYEDDDIDIIPDPMPDESPKSMGVSEHAGMRYVQRMLNLHVKNESEAKRYWRDNIDDINSKIVDGFNSSELLFEDDEGIQHTLDADNIIYVSGGNTIITLYEGDFGFTKEINRHIILQQKHEIWQAKWSHDSEVKKYDEVVEETDHQVRQIDNKIQHLESQIELLNQEKKVCLESKTEQMKRVNVASSNFTKEFDKLFKKWTN